MSALRRYLQPLVSPAVFDFWASRLDRTASWDRPLARIVSRRAESRDAVTLVLQANRHFGGFQPGQHLNVTAEIDGARLTRSYSPSQVPGHPRRLSITVRRVQAGRLSSQLCLRARVGDVLELGPAFGEMTWPRETDGPWLFLAAGSGITPLMSLIRSAAATGRMPDLQLVYWARQRADLCFVDELRALSKALPRLRCHFVLTREASLEAHESAGRPSQVLLDRLVPDPAARRVRACGPHGFVESLRGLLDGRVADFLAESFTPAPLPLAPTGTVRVELARSGRTLEVTTGTPLLAALEAQGLRPAHGCRMGLCNTCACAKQAGTTQDLVGGALDAEPNPALRICVNRAASDLILDL